VRLDHLSYAAGPEGLGACVQRLGAALGSGFHDGGLHPRFGTRNFLLPLANGVYLEVVAALDHPAADKAPFGQAVKSRTEAGGGWLAWVLAVDDLAPLEARLGRPAVAGHRRRPDGTDLTWRQIGVLDLLDDPALPFFVQWQSDPALHPSVLTADDQPPGITRVEICGDETKVGEWLGEPVAKAEFQIDWVDGGEPGLAAVHFSTHRGIVRID
jgi:Glyoxalase-like domain